MPDGTLLHLRDTYPIETAWAPKWVGDELRQVRTAAREANLAAFRAAAEAHPAHQYPPLRSAEPPPATPAQRDQLTLTPGEQIQQTGQWIKDLAAQRRTF